MISDRVTSGFGDRLILLAGSSADADGSHDCPIPLQRDAAREDHYFAVVGCVNSKELLSRLARCAQLLG